jgi:anti-sigma factor RsiW
MTIMFGHCRGSLDAYLDGQLTPKARRRVAQHISRCETCYADYARRRDLRDELQRTMPLIGADQPDFKRMWHAIRVELPRDDRRRTQARYGLAALMLMLSLLIPFTMGHRDIPMVLPSRPAPDSTLEQGTPSQREPVAVATIVVSVTQGHEKEAATQLPTVPEPEHGN